MPDWQVPDLRGPATQTKGVFGCSGSLGCFRIAPRPRQLRAQRAGLRMKPLDGVCVRPAFLCNRPLPTVPRARTPLSIDSRGADAATTPTPEAEFREPTRDAVPDDHAHS